MQATQSSRPASGAEHQFSHLWDMEHLKYNGASVSHGFKVGIGTLASTAFLEMLLETPVEELDVEKCVAAWKSWEETEADIRRISITIPNSWPADWWRPGVNMSIRRGCAGSCSV